MTLTSNPTQPTTIGTHDGRIPSSETHRHDLEEALLTMTDSQTMRDAGINEQFARTYAKHAHRLELLPKASRQQIAEQFSHMAREFSYIDAVGRKHPETMQRRIAAWLNAVLVLLILQSKGPA